ncbi:SycD/LcrH family type III secretion system chaperone [Candidatus Similichlamydia laticola]|uniref:Low Calcium Response Protein H n=1 Tax=Candidatus Similichlamydia laticola TaxID=2170265 RepID=A0A369KJ69_9BACT|nr:SycD/LcrH family type III secretion system chaperone [Candidatus Similichlamydia laticola]RDB31804.1 Low Calcium Response Protein H [Candidatus Similichlamydia laticola]
MLENILSYLHPSESSAEQLRLLFRLFAEQDFSTQKDEQPPLPQDEIYEEFSQKLAQAIGLVYEKGVLFKDALGLSEENMEAFYAWGFQLFEKKQFSEAFQLFNILVILDPIQWKYRYALATTLHRQKNYKDAVKAYLMSVMLEPARYIPLPHYHAADCYIQMQDFCSAIVMLDLCMKHCDPDSSEHQIILERAEVLKKALEEKWSYPIKG